VGARFEELLPEVSAFECAGELLRAWDARGPRILLATSSPKELLDEMRARIDADDVVADMVTATDVEHAKPHPQIFDAALAKSGVARDEAIVVGDSVWDVTSAARAGLRCIALESGGYSRLELEHAGVAAVYRDPEDLLGHLDDWK